MEGSGFFVRLDYASELSRIAITEKRKPVKCVISMVGLPRYLYELMLAFEALVVFDGGGDVEVLLFAVYVGVGYVECGVVDGAGHADLGIVGVVASERGAVTVLEVDNEDWVMDFRVVTIGVWRGVVVLVEYDEVFVVVVFDDEVDIFTGADDIVVFVSYRA